MTACNNLYSHGSPIMQPTTATEVAFDHEQCTDTQGGSPNTLYLFACHLQGDKYGDLRAYAVFVSALDSNDEEARMVAQTLHHRKSPRPTSCSQCARGPSFAGQEHQQCPS